MDAGRIVVQGRSWSGYWAAKLAITERDRLRGAVMHGGPIHHYFQPEWLKPSLLTGEYLYDYQEAKCAMHGAVGLDDLLGKARPFSLLDLGLLDRPSAPMLLVNGARDTQIPIADLYLLLGHGDPKEAWVNPQGGHMGRSPQWPGPAIAGKVLMPWITRRLASTGHGEFAAAADPAANYPSRPVRLIIANTTGTSVDTLSRVMASKLGEELGQQIVSDNRAGAGGTIGAEIAAQAAPDGHTLLQ